MLRSQKAAAAAQPGYGPPPPRTRPLGRAARTLRAPAVCEGEIDVEYGAEDDGGKMPSEYGNGAEQPGAEWWLEGAQADHHRPHRRAVRAEQLVNQGSGSFHLCVGRPRPPPQPPPRDLPPCPPDSPSSLCAPLDPRTPVGALIPSPDFTLARLLLLFNNTQFITNLLRLHMSRLLHDWPARAVDVRLCTCF